MTSASLAGAACRLQVLHRNAGGPDRQLHRGRRRSGRQPDVVVSPTLAGRSTDRLRRHAHIELTDEELRLLQNALHAYLDDFGHEEADVLREVKALIEKLQRGMTGLARRA